MSDISEIIEEMEKLLEQIRNIIKGICCRDGICECCHGYVDDCRKCQGRCLPCNGTGVCPICSSIDHFRSELIFYNAEEKNENAS